MSDLSVYLTNSVRLLLAHLCIAYRVPFVAHPRVLLTKTNKYFQVDWGVLPKVEQQVGLRMG